MMRCVQIGNEVLAMTWKEHGGKVTLCEMRIVPLVMFDNINKGYRYEEIHRP